ncbi:hypothetical protein [Streptomyces sp. NPDC012510]
MATVLTERRALPPFPDHHPSTTAHRVGSDISHTHQDRRTT